MLVRYLPLIFVLAALALALAPLEAAGQSPVPNGSAIDAAHAQASSKADKPRPKAASAPNANAGKTPVPPDTDARGVRPAEAFPPERIAPSGSETPQAPTRGGVRPADPASASPAQKDDPRSVEERADPGG
jgi:hypothetical protein